MTVGTRIAVIGCCGAGKSHLSRRLGDKLGLPVVHLDQLAWKPGWIEVPNSELAIKQQELFTRDRPWIADGNFGSTMMIRLAAAETVVFLDFPTTICLYRVMKRRVIYFRRTRPDMTPGCPETFLDIEVAKFIHYVATFRRKQRPRILDKLAQLDGSQHLITLASPREVDAFVASL